jgi:hypothetical protein
MRWYCLHRFTWISGDRHCLGCQCGVANTGRAASALTAKADSSRRRDSRTDSDTHVGDTTAANVCEPESPCSSGGLAWLAEDDDDDDEDDDDETSAPADSECKICVQPARIAAAVRGITTPPNETM